MDPQNAIAVNPIDLPRTVCDRPIVLEALRATPGLRERLACGIHVADIGCGAGVSTLTMAVAFPRSRFLGVDADPASLERARQLRALGGLRNVYWLAAAADQLAPRPTHDLICAFGGLRGLGDPRGALRAARAALTDDGVFLWSTPHTEAGLVWQLAPETGFESVERVRLGADVQRLFALRP